MTILRMLNKYAMRKATMFIVGMLMIAMLVGFGASAAAPAEIEGGVGNGSRTAPPVDGVVSPPEEIPEDTPLRYADSWGLYWAECSCPGCPLPEPVQEDPAVIR